MTREEFINTVRNQVAVCAENVDLERDNAQVRVNPVTLDVMVVNGSDFMAEIADSDEAVEDAAAAERPADKDATDYQVAQNPDFYAVSRLVRRDGGKVVTDDEAIERVASLYFK